MLDRRTLIASGVTASCPGAAWGRYLDQRLAKRRAIDSIEVPETFNGALAYARGGRIEHVRCIGMADVEAGRPITPDTQYRWGSASKWVTTVAVLRLVEQGRLSLDLPITTWLPDFRRDTGSRVHLKHLLSNTSGIPDLLSRQVAKEPALRSSSATADAMVARFGGGDLDFTPGQGWDYSALNWVILAALMERVMGEPLPQLVARLVFRPVGMSGAGFAQPGEPPMPALAAAYAGDLPLTRKMSPAPAFVAATGNVVGTVRDAVRVAHGVFHGGLLRPASLRALTTVQWAEQEYALGGRVHSVDGAPWAWETGKVGGYRTHIAHRLSHSETVVIFNTTDMDQSAISAWVETIART